MYHGADNREKARHDEGCAIRRMTGFLGDAGVVERAECTCEVSLDPATEPPSVFDADHRVTA
jgi:hypothetical protein